MNNAGVDRRLQKWAQHQHRVQCNQINPSRLSLVPRSLFCHCLSIAIPIL
ncbi:hypothetical protein HanIR_Chr09g0445961 [Helianthus annuus]|nr:hypothetical protein HanIR_Chr09g0445961 [Helianthus annuus]